MNPITNWFRNRRLRHELADEADAHLRERVDDLVESGLSEAEAWRQARHEFGNTAFYVEAGREAWGWMWADRLAQDIRHGVRVLRKSPAFTTIAVLSLGLGIGANTAIFSVIDSLMLRRLPVRDPQTLVMPEVSEGSDTLAIFSYPAFQRLRQASAVFADAAAAGHVDVYNATVKSPASHSNGGGDAGLLRVGMVSGNYFAMLGVSAVRGRTLTPEDDRVVGDQPVAVISYGYWQRRFAEAASAMGSSVTMNQTIFTIIGVAPPGFTGEWIGRPVDMWVPVTMSAGVLGWPPTNMFRSNTAFLQILARLQPKVTVRQAEAASEVAFREIQQEILGPSPRPESVRRLARQRLVIQPAATGYSPQRQSLWEPLAILMTIVGLVLLLACGNVANLLLARSVVRSRDLSVRVALGAGRGRIIRQLLVENLMLAMLGAAVGLLLAVFGTSFLSTVVGSAPAMMRSNVNTIPKAISLAAGIDWRIFGFGAVLGLATGLLFGLAPAVRASTAAFSSGLRSQGAGGSAGRWRLSKALATAQVALTLPLLIGAGLFVGSLRNLKSQDFGFKGDRLLLVWTSPSAAGLGNTTVTSLGVNLGMAARERIARLPGVVSASASAFGLMGGLGNNDAYRVTVEGYLPKPDEEAVPFMPFNLVSPGFFSTAGMNVLEGRDFTDRDNQTAPRVAIVDDIMARHYWGNESPIGKHLRIKRDAGFPVEIVGVVRRAKYYTPRGASGFWMSGMMYLPYLQDRHDITSALCLAVRIANDSSSLRSAIVSELHDLDAKLPVLDIVTMEEQLNKSLVTERLLSALSSAFGLLAMFLACLGLYGVISFTVAQRTSEIGIRMALGATRSSVLSMVVREGLLLVILGISAGLPLALASTRWVSSWLFGVAATDPRTIGGATLLLIAVALIAGFLPARRASRIDPMEALHYE